MGAILRLLEKVYAEEKFDSVCTNKVYLINYNRDKTGINPVTMIESHQRSFIYYVGGFKNRTKEKKNPA